MEELKYIDNKTSLNGGYSRYTPFVSLIRKSLTAFTPFKWRFVNST